MFPFAASLLRTLRRRSSWLTVVMGLSMGVPVFLGALQMQATYLESAVDLTDLSEEVKKSEHILSDSAVEATCLAPAKRSTMADAPAPRSCAPDAPPTPPPDQNA